LANNWLKPKALVGGGYASTYAAKVDHVEKKKELVEKKEIPKGIRALGAHLFMVEEFTANGEHE
jgi:hypothetical protein